MPHQNRSRPSTSRTGTPGTAASHLADVARREHVRLARQQHDARRPRRDFRRASPPDSDRASRRRRCRRRAGRAATRRTCRSRATSTVGATPRRTRPTNAASASRRASRPTRRHRTVREPRVSTCSARARTSGPTSPTERGDIECSVRPAVGERRARPRRGSPRRSRRRGPASARGSRARSGFFVPPTTDAPAAPASQNRVIPTGSTPSARNVSVADGTSETTRRTARVTCARAAAPSSPRTRPR